MKFRQFLKGELNKELLLKILLFSSAITFLVTGLNLYSDYRADLNELSRTFEKIEKSYVNIVRQGLWEMSPKRIKMQLEGIERLPDIIYAKVEPTNSPAISVGVVPSSEFQTKEYPLVYRHKGENYELGKLIVMASYREIYQKLYGRALLIFGMQGVKTFFVSIFILLIVGRLITRHLETIAAKLKSPHFLRSKSAISLPGNRKKKNELDQVVESLNSLKSNLQNAHEEQENLIKQLNRRNSDMVEFLYTITHDLKGPLVSIQGHNSLMKKHLGNNPTPMQQELLKRVDRAVDQMSDQLKELIQLCKVGRKEFSTENVNVFTLVNEVIETIPKIPGVRYRVSRNLPILEADRESLFQIFQALLENAIKFSRKDLSPLIEVGCHESMGNHIFSVRDNGLGIPPEYHTKVFDIFQRLDKNPEGSGLGLALVKRIVESLGGRVWLESRGLNKGSTFFFTLGETMTPVLEEEA